MLNAEHDRFVIIYTRYSSDMQRAESCDIQERAVRAELQRLGIPDGSAKVLKDEALSGTDEGRPEYRKLIDWCSQGRIGVLAVYDQSRLSRGKVRGLIEDIVFHGGRFISVGEHTDTKHEGWQLTVGISEIHHAVSNRDTARRVRSGLENRLRDGHGSNGNFPYGYKSQYRDPNWAELLASGQKPKKDVAINDSEADTVREIFKLYADGKMSLNQIARRMRERKVPLGIRGRKWCHKRIEKILANRRYVGDWSWGKTESVQNSCGKKRQRPVDSSRVTVADRPLLRIIDQDLWNRTRARRDEMRSKYGIVGRMKIHPKHLYPTCNLSGLVRCGACGSRLVITTNRATMHKYLLCPEQKHGNCNQKRQINVRDAETALFEFLGQLCNQWPEWLAAITKEVHRLVQDNCSRTPAALATCEKQVNAVDRQITNLVDKMSTISGTSAALTNRLAELERDHSELCRKQATLKSQHQMPAHLPDEDFIRKELGRFPELLTEASTATADLLRRVFSNVSAVEVRRPGRKRTHMVLRVELNPINVLFTALGEEWTQRLTAMGVHEHASAEGENEIFVLAVSKPGKYESAAPIIHQLRLRKIGWEEIGEKVEITRQNCISLYKRYLQDLAMLNLT